MKHEHQQYSIQLKLGVIIIACAVLYALAAWAAWVIQSFTGVHGNTFCMALFFMVLAQILPKKYGGLPVLALTISTFYIWILL